MSKVYHQAEARMAQDAWAMAADAQRRAEERMSVAWSMEAMAEVARVRKEQEAAWRRWQRAEARAEAA